MPKRLIPILLLAGLIAGAGRARAADHLRGESSEFLKAFTDSPVDWMPWGEPAFARAKAEARPVFLFIGSFTSELSGAMRRQTFANPKNADWLNKHFVCVVVDRDERPDVAALYEAYVLNLKQVSGWPLNVWLTPEFQPYEGATYLSPSEDWGAPGFLKLANQAQAAWAANPAGCRKRAADSVAQLAPPAQAPAPAQWNPVKARERLAASAAAWLATFDPAQGGFGDPPKSPEPELIRFMLRQSPASRSAAMATLRAVAVSAVRDPLDGGFFRHAADAAWRIPYPQKTLADQARVALAYLDGATGADARLFGLCARGAIDFALRRLSHPDGTFFAAEDATGDDFAGYYTWTEAEISAALGADAKAFEAAHGAAPDGNVPAADDPSAQYAHKNLLRSTADADAAWTRDASLLLSVRERRGAPPRDGRATAGAYGLMLSALSRAGEQLRSPAYVDAARRTLRIVRAGFLVSPDGTLRRLMGSSLPASAGDYAALALGCRDYARAANDGAARELSTRLLAQLDSRYLDPASGAYFGAPSPPGPGFFMRPPGAEDPPSAESLAVAAGGPHAQAVAAGLSASLEESSAQAPGDQLLALALFCGP
jgi:uncharacterized protein YyaL (SSP411 family)